MIFILGLILGAMFGVVAGILVASLCVISKESDETLKRI